MKRCYLWLISLLLCVAIVGGMTGCTQEPPVPSSDPTEPSASESQTVPPPDAAEVYEEAADALRSLSEVTMNVDYTTKMTVAGEEFSELRTQVLSYAGLNTENWSAHLEEKLTYDLDGETKADSETEMVFKETYINGVLYIDFIGEALFSGELTPEKAAEEYVPVVLLDASLYETLTYAETSVGGEITFSEPTAAEDWALPKGGKLIDASGMMRLDAAGKVQQMQYSLSYEYGSAKYEIQVISWVKQDGALPVTAPEKANEFLKLEYPQALRDYVYASAMVVQGKSVSVTTAESIFVQAAGVMRNQSVELNLHGHGDDLITKVDSNLFLMDYNTGDSQKLQQKETYEKGKYVSVVDDGVPTTQTGVKEEEIAEYLTQIIFSNFADPSLWKTVKTTDLGSVYLLEFTYSEDFGNTLQNSICTILWQDPAFLNNLASAYETTKVEGYMAFEKFTGLPTAAGFTFAGKHTIDGMDYVMTLQSDESVKAPGLGAYHAITDERLPEAEPENKATPLFYKVTGKDGQQMWLLGTIHVGDARTAYLPKEIYDAFAQSDALALEFDSGKFEERMKTDEEFANAVSATYLLTGGQTAESIMDAQLYEVALKMLKASGNYNMNALAMKPVIWEQSISNFFLQQCNTLHSDMGVESRLEELAAKQNKEILDVESGLFQAQMQGNFSTELQLAMLEDILEENFGEYREELTELYDAWCAGDEKVLRELVNEQEDTSKMTAEELAEYNAQEPLRKEYEKAMETDRNEGMLDVAIDYLEGDQVVFFAVGLAHLLDDTNGLVDALRTAGYTVELVKYQA